MTAPLDLQSLAAAVEVLTAHPLRGDGDYITRETDPEAPRGYSPYSLFAECGDGIGAPLLTLIAGAPALLALARRAQLVDDITAELLIPFPGGSERDQRDEDVKRDLLTRLRKLLGLPVEETTP